MSSRIRIVEKPLAQNYAWLLKKDCFWEPQIASQGEISDSLKEAQIEIGPCRVEYNMTRRH